MNRHTFCAIASVISSLFLLTVSARTAKAQDYLLQTGTPPFTTPDAVPLGFVNVANGQIHLEIPITSALQRGRLGFSARMVYDSRIWEPSAGTWHHDNVPYSQDGWRMVSTANVGGVFYSSSALQCFDGDFTHPYTTYGPFTWTAADGTVHVFGVLTQRDNYGCAGGNISSGNGYSNDSMGYYMSVTNYTSVTGIWAKDGTQVYPTVTDTNGNYLNSSGDTLGRAVITYVANGSGCTSSYCYNILAPNGGTAQVKVTTTSVSYNTAFGLSGFTEASGSFTAIQSITLPDNTSYTLGYDSGTSAGHYGELTSVTLPTGAQMTYTYTVFPTTTSTESRNAWVTQRTMSGGTWQYALSDNVTCPSGAPSGSTCFTSTIEPPSGNWTVYNFIRSNGSWPAVADYYTGTSSGTHLMNVSTTYDFSHSPHVFKSAVSTTLYGAGGAALTKKSTYTYYSTQYGNVIQIADYKFGNSSGTPDRKTSMTYSTNTNYTNRNILSLLTENKVTDGAGTTTYSDTKFTYDSTTLQSVSVTPTHWTDPGTTYRGNPTYVQRWISGSTWANTTITYDTTGQVFSSLDPKNNPTSFSYGQQNCSSSYQNAYPTQITNALNQYTYICYDINTGLVTSLKDPNDQTTTFSYDSMLRLTGTSYPDYGSVSISYPSATEIDTTTAIDSSRSRSDTVYLDGLGRTHQTVLVSDPEGADKVDVTYNAVGLVGSVSNPYRGASPAGGDSYVYDGLRRATQVTHADSNAAYTYYGAAVGTNNGRTTQLCSATGYPSLRNDERGMLLQTWTDAWGAVVEVDEPDPATGSLTSGSANGTCYSYDLLGNLTGVVQGSSQTRTYVYDGLSRLTSAATPESGTTYFYYTTSGGSLCSGDPNTVCRRTDARNITTTYSYDALNRLTGKTYSDSTPPTAYAYDQTSVTIGSWSSGTLANPVGRLVAATTTSSGSVQTASVFSYDPMGRPANHWQCTPQNCNSSMWLTSYGYDLAGDVASWTHPAGPTLTNAVSTAQRITGITSSLSDSTHPATLTQSMTYAPWGALSSLQNGCVGSGCVQRQETYVYNNRMQPVMIELGTSGTVSANYCLVYNYYSDIASPTSCAVPSQGTLNNGYVLGYYYQDNVNSSLSHTTAFPRDGLKRLGTAQATGNWTYNLTFSYDRYGNMTCVTNGQTQGPCPNWTYDATTNRITTFTYDAAGNVLSDSAHQYTWDGEGRLATMDGGSTANIVYDAFGQMVRNLTDNHLYNPAGQRISKLVGGTWNWGIVPWGDVAMVKWASSETYFVHHNNLESSTMSTDHAGAVQEDMLYYPWGQAKTPSTVVDGTFATMRTLVPTAGEETLVTPNRFYSATYGRWLSPDPLAGDITNPQSLNRYAYALNNPVTFADPSGLGPCDNYSWGYGKGRCLIGTIGPSIAEDLGDSDEFDWAALGILPGFTAGEDDCSNPVYAVSHAECATRPLPIPPVGVGIWVGTTGGASSGEPTGCAGGIVEMPPLGFQAPYQANLPTPNAAWNNFLCWSCQTNCKVQLVKEAFTCGVEAAAAGALTSLIPGSFITKTILQGVASAATAPAKQECKQRAIDKFSACMSKCMTGACRGSVVSVMP